MDRLFAQMLLRPEGMNTTRPFTTCLNRIHTGLTIRPLVGGIDIANGVPYAYALSTGRRWGQFKVRSKHAAVVHMCYVMAKVLDSGLVMGRHEGGISVNTIRFRRISVVSYTLTVVENISSDNFFIS